MIITHSRATTWATTTRSRGSSSSELPRDPRRSSRRGRPHHDSVPPIYLMETVAGVGFTPTEFVDVTETIDAKVAMLEAHQSQLPGSATTTARHRREDARRDRVPRLPVRGPVRRGLRAVPGLAARDDKGSFRRTEEARGDSALRSRTSSRSATSRPASASARSSAPRSPSTRTPTSGSGSSASTTSSTARLPRTSSRASGSRARRDGRFVGILPGRPDAAVRDRRADDQRGAAVAAGHVHTFNMDEYANEHGDTAPLSWPGSFQRAMSDRFFDADRRRAAPARGEHPLSDDRDDRRLLEA